MDLPSAMFSVAASRFHYEDPVILENIPIGVAVERYGTGGQVEGDVQLIDPSLSINSESDPAVEYNLLHAAFKQNIPDVASESPDTVSLYDEIPTPSHPAPGPDPFSGSVTDAVDGDSPLAVVNNDYKSDSHRQDAMAESESAYSSDRDTSVGVQRQLLGFPSGEPSEQPSGQPSGQPTGAPTSPSGQPTGMPTCPSGQPTGEPSSQPSGQPTGAPSCPSGQPSSTPSGWPSGRPTCTPVSRPSTMPSAEPTCKPSGEPSGQPTCLPSGEPSAQPTCLPSSAPSAQPTAFPTCPTGQPSAEPTGDPSAQPTGVPSGQPSRAPTGEPSGQPSSIPTCPSGQPTGVPTCPTGQPSSEPSGQPSGLPTGEPTAQPSTDPSGEPSAQPSGQPTGQPTGVPTCPSGQPSGQPSGEPSGQPSGQPSGEPSGQPSAQPTCPTGQPSGVPTCPTGQPSGQPSGEPSGQPSAQPTCPTGQPSSEPSGEPSSQPTSTPSAQPTQFPSGEPSGQPTRVPSGEPSGQPTQDPTSPSGQPTGMPTCPTGQPSTLPSGEPSGQPSGQPSSQPTCPSGQPSSSPTCPSGQPTGEPSTQPSGQPSAQPSSHPTCPSGQPTSLPTRAPVVESYLFTLTPIMKQCFTGCADAGLLGSISSLEFSSPEFIVAPREEFCGLYTASNCLDFRVRQFKCVPACMHSESGVLDPGCGPAFCASYGMLARSCPSNYHPNNTIVADIQSECLRTYISVSGGGDPEVTFGLSFSIGASAATVNGDEQIKRAISSSISQVITGILSVTEFDAVDVITGEPTGQPTGQPSGEPSRQPSGQPTGAPTSPSGQPTGMPTCPSGQPTGEPSSQPSGQPTGAPTSPSGQPTGMPTGEPSSQPTGKPTVIPTVEPTDAPSRQPTRPPTCQPSLEPSDRPSSQPSGKPSSQPTMPTGQPTGQPSGVVALTSRGRRRLDEYEGECVISVVITGVPVQVSGELVSTAAEGVQAMTEQFVAAVDSGDFNRVLSSTTKALHIDTLSAAAINAIRSSSVIADSSTVVSFSSADPTSNPTAFVAEKEIDYYLNWPLTALIGVAGGVGLVVVCMVCYLRYRSFRVGRIHSACAAIEAEYVAHLGPVPLVSTAGRKIRSHGNGGRGYNEVSQIFTDCGGSSAVSVLTAADGEVVLGDDGQPLVLNYVEPSEHFDISVPVAVPGVEQGKVESVRCSRSASSRSSRSSKSENTDSDVKGVGGTGAGVDEVLILQPPGSDPSSLLLEGLPDTSALNNKTGTVAQADIVDKTSASEPTDKDADVWPLADV